MARKGYRSKLKLKSRQKRASVDEADGTIIECAVCAKKIVIVSLVPFPLDSNWIALMTQGGRLQKRRILWDGVETHACNACGISVSHLSYRQLFILIIKVGYLQSCEGKE
jgi:hypothetical protein